ncbi:MAG TPA: MdtA/MuxA family multidrug efflux RND transporter periplasmic adaptor subunit [Stellaceae bacterium]
MDDSSPPLRQLPPPRRRWLRWVLVLLAIIILLAIGWRWWLQPRLNPKPQATGTTAVSPRGAGGGRGRFQAAGAQPVGAATVATGDIDITLNALGTVTPLATVTVRTQINGQLVQIAFTEGQIVKKGDFLAEIDPRPYQIALQQAQGQLARDQALLKGAQVDLARYQKLARQNSIAQQQADDQLYLARQYEGTVKLDEAGVANAKLNLAYCHIVSPVAGKAGLRQVDVGNYVQTSDANGIVVVTQLQPITVLFPVAEDFLPQIQKREAAGAKLPVTAYDRAMTTKLAAGTLYAIDSQIDPTTGTVKMKAQFDNADFALFPQQFVNAKLLIDTLKDVVIAPTAAIQRGAPGTFVFLIKTGNKVAVTNVKLGPVQGEQVAVLSGLAAGDRVVVDGADRLRDGVTVTVPQAKGGAPGAKGGGGRRAGANTGPAAPKAAATAGGPADTAAPATITGSNLGKSSPVKGKSPNLGGNHGPGYNPPPDQLTNPGPAAPKSSKSGTTQ